MPLLILIFFYFESVELSPATASMIERLGFPIVIALVLLGFFYKLVNRLLDEHKQQNELLRESLKANTVELKKLVGQFSRLTIVKPADNVRRLKTRKISDTTHERKSQT